MDKEEKLNRCVLIYGGIKYCQKHIDEDITIDDNKKEEIKKLLKTQEETVISILRFTFDDDSSKESLNYRIFKLFQKDFYSIC